MTTIEERGTAVGFCDSNEKEGEYVGVGKIGVEKVEEPETGVPEEEEILEEAEEAADA